MRATPKAEIWKSPIPYLFGGLSLVLLLIALALFSLVCIHKKSHSFNNTYPVEEEEDAGDNEAKTVIGEYLPKIVVILAGEDQPTCLAVPSREHVEMLLLPLCLSGLSLVSPRVDVFVYLLFDR
ncbi:hypothetical protein YC2023_085757 [Brassica napus]